MELTLKRSLFIIAFFICVSVYGQRGDHAAILLDSFLAADQRPLNTPESFSQFLKKLEKKHASVKHEDDFIYHLFVRAHSQYLKKYDATAPISNLFNTGSYNCLTGTILYAVLLNHFQIPHQVIETNYHIFILAETKQGKILLEATDRVNGFVTSPREIESRMNKYKADLSAGSNTNYSYQFNFKLLNSVSLKELRGLLYYNKSVNAFNNHNLQEAVQFLKEAHAVYTSARMDEFSQILLIALQQSKIENQVRMEYIKTVLSIKIGAMPIVASLD
jgi:hypothetical protein